MQANPLETGRFLYARRFGPQLKMHGILDYDPLLSTSYDTAYEQLKRNLNHQFWIGPDVLLTSNTVLNYGWNEVPVLITPHHLPLLDGLPPEAIWLLEISTRSRLAQTGVDVQGLLDQNGALGIDPDKWQALKQGQPQLVTASLFSHNRLALPQRTGLFRFFSHKGSEIQRDDSLTELIHNQGIIITGTEGVDWHWLEIDGHPIGIQARLDPHKKWWLLRSQLDPPLAFPTGKNFHQARSSLEEILQPVPPQLSDVLRSIQKTIFWVGQTSSSITIRDPRCHAVVDVSGLIEDPRFDKQFSLPTRHTQSPLLQGPKPDGTLVTNNSIRVEIVGVPDEVNSVPIIFFRSGTPKPLQL